MDKIPTQADFKSQINQEFIIVGDQEGEQSLEILTLENVSDITDIGGGFKSYGMSFATPLKKSYLPQKQWPMKNDALGEFSLFLVPAGPEDGCFKYNVTLTFQQNRK